MITQCPHCKTEFLLEDADLPPGGLSLECAGCRQVFGVLAQPAARGKAANKTQPPTVAPGLALPLAADDDVILAPAPAALPEWRLKRESGEVVSVHNLDAVKQRIAEGQARPGDLLTRDGVSWQRLANMRDLIPAFELAQSPDATRLVERRAFVVNVADIEAKKKAEIEAEPESPDTWPGPRAPLVVEPPARRASTRYDHDKTHPFSIPMNLLHVDYRALWLRQRRVRRVLGGVLSVTLVLGLVLWVAPQWLHRVVGALYRESVPEVAVNLVHQGYSQLYPDTVASLQTAGQTFKRAINVSSGYAEAHAGLAETWLTLAETYRLQAQAQSGRSGDKKRVRGKAPAPAPTPEAVAGLEKEALDALQAGLSEAQTALRLNPESVAANRAMLLYHEVAGSDAARSAPYLRQARAAAPDDPRVMYLEIIAANPAPARAIEEYRNVVERMPRFNRARYKLARLYMQQNDMEHAREQVTAILASAPAHTLARLLLNPDGSEYAGGVAAVVSNLPAGEKLGRPSRQPPQPSNDLPPGASYEALVHQGQLLRATHQLPAAVALYERAVARDKRRVAAYIGLAWCQLEQDQSGPAMLNFTYATELSPWSVEAHYGLAEAMRAQGDLQQAVKQYRQVLAIEPDGAMGRLARETLDEISR